MDPEARSHSTKVTHINGHRNYDCPNKMLSRDEGRRGNVLTFFLTKLIWNLSMWSLINIEVNYINLTPTLDVYLQKGS